jgi:hypothetical protein
MMMGDELQNRKNVKKRISDHNAEKMNPIDGADVAVSREGVLRAPS